MVFARRYQAYSTRIAAWTIIFLMTRWTEMSRHLLESSQARRGD